MLAELAIPAVMQLIQSLVPSLSTAGPSVVGSTIAVLTEYAPVVFKEFQALKPVVLDAIEAMHGNSNTTQEQIAKLRELVKADDQEFDVALARARAEDQAAGDS